MDDNTSDDNASLEHEQNMTMTESLGYNINVKTEYSSSDASTDNSFSETESQPTIDSQNASFIGKSKSLNKSDPKSKSMDDEKNDWRSKNRRIVWKYFRKETKGTARCIPCKRVIKHTGNGIGPLKQHLIKLHSYIRFHRKPMTRTNELLVEGHTDYETTPESSSESEDDVPKPKRTKRKLRSEEKLTGSNEEFERTNSAMGKSDTVENITNAILHMIFVDKMPLSTVENKGFKFLMRRVAPFYSVPNTETITRLLDARYEGSRNGSVLNLTNADSYSLTVDCWKSGTCNHLDVFVRYVTEELRVENIRVGSFSLPIAYGQKYLLDLLSSLIGDMGLVQSKITAVVNGRGLKSRKVIRDLFGEDKYLDCFSSTLAQFLPSLLRNMPELRLIIDKVRIIVKIMETNVVASDELRAIQIRDGKTEENALKFINEVPKYWNSTLRMLERYFILERYVSPVISRLPKAPDTLTENEINILNDFVSLMKPFERVITELNEESYSTCSVIIPTVKYLKTAIGQYESRTDWGLRLREILRAMIAAGFMNLGEHKVLQISTILDPRFKASSFEYTHDASFAISQIFETIENTGLRITGKIKCEVTVDERDETCDMSNYHVHSGAMGAAIESENEELKFELKQYLNEALVPRNEDPLRYWKSRKIDLPLLHDIALRYVVIIGNSVPSNRRFYRNENAQNEPIEAE